MDDEKDLVKLDENLPAKSGGITEEDFDEDLFDRLSPKQQKYVEMSASTGLSRADLAKHLGVSKHMLTKWDKNPDVQLLKRTIQRKLMSSSVEQMRMQNKQMRDKVFAEMMSRFEDPPANVEADLEDEDKAVAIRKMQAQRYAKYASFDSMIKAMKEVNQAGQMEDEVVGNQESEFVEKVRKRIHKVTRKQQAFREKAAEVGGGSTSYLDLVTDNGIDFYDAPKTKSPEEVVEEEVVEVTEISIIKRDKDE